jgi:hypothetical protein
MIGGNDSGNETEGHTKSKTNRSQPEGEEIAPHSPIILMPKSREGLSKNEEDSTRKSDIRWHTNTSAYRSLAFTGKSSRTVLRSPNVSGVVAYSGTGKPSPLNRSDDERERLRRRLQKFKDFDVNELVSLACSSSLSTMQKLKQVKRLEYLRSRKADSYGLLGANRSSRILAKVQ